MAPLSGSIAAKTGRASKLDLLRHFPGHILLMKVKQLCSEGGGEVVGPGE